MVKPRRDTMSTINVQFLGEEYSIPEDLPFLLNFLIAAITIRGVFFLCSHL